MNSLVFQIIILKTVPNKQIAPVVGFRASPPQSMSSMRILFQMEGRHFPSHFPWRYFTHFNLILFGDSFCPNEPVPPSRGAPAGGGTRHHFVKTCFAIIHFRSTSFRLEANYHCQGAYWEPVLCIDCCATLTKTTSSNGFILFPTISTLISFFSTHILSACFLSSVISTPSLRPISFMSRFGHYLFRQCNIIEKANIYVPHERCGNGSSTPGGDQPHLARILHRIGVTHNCLSDWPRGVEAFPP